MKLKTVAALRASGGRLFGITNGKQNAPMRGFNRRLGYVPDPPRIVVEMLL